MYGLLDNQAERIAQQRREALIRGLHKADDARGVPRRNLSEEEIQQYLMTRQPLQDYVESASENPYMGGNLTPQDLWKSQAHSMSPDYLAQNNMAEELPPHHAIHGGGYSLGKASGSINSMAEPNYPRFPAANQMGIAEGYDHQRINPPASLAGGMGPGQGLLDTPTRGQQPPLSEAVTKTNNRKRGSRQGWENNPAYQMMIQQGMKLYGGY